MLLGMIEEQTINEQSNIDIEEKAEELIPEDVPAEDLAIIREMMKAGLMYGHKKSKTNPKFRRYIYANRNGVEIIDLGQTLPVLEAAIEILQNHLKEKKSVLVVATQSAAREAVENLAKKFNFSYINDRWIGGLLTNFKVISQRLEYFKKTQSDLEKGKFDKYTKKERVMINRNIFRMGKMFTGLENLLKLPDIIFVIDPSLKGHATAIREAKRVKIPVMAILDSDDDPDTINWPIPANDHAKMSIDWIINKISNSLESNNSPESISN